MPGSDLAGGLADDGKRFSSDGRCICRWVDEIEEWGGGLGEGGCQIVRGRTVADDGKRFSSDGRFVSKG